MEAGFVEGVSPDTLASLLSSPDQAGRPTLVVDCRPFMAYNSGHILESVNVHCPPILKRRSGGFVALENIVVDKERRERLQRGAYGSVVVYDQNTDDLQGADRESSLYSVLKSLGQQVSMDSVVYLLGGYDAFSEECPLLCVTQQFCPLSTGLRPEAQRSTTDQDDAPVEILPHLLLGSERHSSRREVLERLGVTALVNVSTSCANRFPGSFRYLNVPAHDTACQDLAVWFPLTNRFIDEVQAEGGRVLVHCQAGRSRSATVCLAYLIRTLHLPLDAAFEHVRARRHVIDPNLNFMRQLQDYCQRLGSERTLSGSVDPGTAAASSSLLPPLGSSGSSSVTSEAGFAWSGGCGVSSGCTSMSSSGLSSASSSTGPGALPRLSRTPKEATAPISLPSGSSLSPGDSAADLPLPPSSPATANDVHCFFVFSSAEMPAFPTELPTFPTEFPFPSSAMARTPEIPQPS
ncbi:hypothetical protein ACOMHN_017190 [Nucella lapillus]